MGHLATTRILGRQGHRQGLRLVFLGRLGVRLLHLRREVIHPVDGIRGADVDDSGESHRGAPRPANRRFCPQEGFLHLLR